MELAQWFVKSTAAIPGINVWELVVMALIFTVGLTGLLGGSAGMVYLVLGNWANVWYACLVFSSVIYIAGQGMMPPNGLVVSMFGSICISIGAICVYAGLAVFLSTLFFSGYSALLIFAIGGIARTFQLFAQLNRLQRVVSYVSKEGNGINRTGTDYYSS